jgi:RNA polymerase sigma factor (sigma-70 family)
MSRIIGRHREDASCAKPSDVNERFADFYEANFQPCVRLAWLLTHSYGDCEEIVQEAFVACYRVYNNLDEPGAYLHKVLINGCRSWGRVRKRRAEIARSLASRPDDVQIRDRAYERIQMLEAIGRLGHRQRVVIVGRYYADWSETEIAEVLNCRPGTVKSLASRAIESLRREWAEQS